MKNILLLFLKKVIMTTITMRDTDPVLGLNRPIISCHANTHGSTRFVASAALPLPLYVAHSSDSNSDHAF